MATTNSFDITTGCDLQEVDNAVNQASKEIGQRYDFKGVKFTLEFKRADNLITIAAADDYKVRAIYDVLTTKLIKRGVPIENLKSEGAKAVGGGSLKQEIKLTQGIDGETAKKIVKFIKDAKLKKVQASIQAEQVRVTSPSRDELQSAISLLKGQNFGIELQFGNYR